MRSYKVNCLDMARKAGDQLGDPYDGCLSKTIIRTSMTDSGSEAVPIDTLREAFRDLGRALASMQY